MTRAGTALVVLGLAVRAAHGTPPVVAIRARTAVTLDPVERQPDGVRVSGRVHERGSLEPVRYAPVTVAFDDQTQTAVSAMDGRFTMFFATRGGRHQLRVNFPGDRDKYEPSDLAVPDFDVSKRPIRVEVRGPETHSRQGGPLPLTIFAQNDVDPVAVPVDVHYGPADADELPKVASATTDLRGAAELAIPADRLGAPGAKRVEVRFAGNDAYDGARGQTIVQLRSATALRFELESRSVAVDGRLRGRGVLVDDAGQGLPGQPIQLSVEGPSDPAATTPPEVHAVDDAVTAADGSFSLEVGAGELGPGSYRVQAVFEPSVPHLDGKRSPPVQVVIAARRPVPLGYSLAAAALTAGCLLAFVLLRRRPWTRWARTLRGETAAAAPPAADAPPHTGLALARPGLAATLRRPHDHGFSGVVADAVDGKPIAGARVAISAPGGATAVAESDDDGRFALEDLPPGQLAAEVSCRGYVREHFTLTIPHRGELRDARVDLLPVRERIFALYRGAAEPLLPRPELWGVWTPRQIVDHVRAQRPAGALGALTDYVEEKYFSARTPDEDELPLAADRVRAAELEAGPASAPPPPATLQ
jgi:hypothetical protein